MAGLLEETEAVDAAGGTDYGEELRDDDMPEELKRREDRMAATQAAKERLAAEQESEGRRTGLDRRAGPFA